MRDALHAEWTKLRTTPSTAWLLAGAIALTVALSALVAAASQASRGAGQDTTKISLTGVVIGQAVIAGLAVVAITSEYATDLIRITLSAMPRRSTVLAAKAVVVTGLTVAASTVAVLGSLLAGRLILPGNGFTRANGYPPLSLADDLTARAAVGSVLYLALIALLSLGAAAVVRDSAASIAVVLGLIYLFPVFAGLVADPDWQRRLMRLGPMTAGLGIQATRNVQDLAISPWSGIGVLAAWAAGALLVGGLQLRLRDA